MTTEKKTPKNKVSRRSFLQRVGSLGVLQFAQWFSFSSLFFPKKALAQLISNSNWRNHSVTGTIWLWGSNSKGQIGNSSTTSASSPVMVGALARYSDISTGSSDAATGHSLAILNDGTLWAWGYNNSGQLGNGNTTDKSSPVQIGAGTTWSKVFAGYSNSFAVKSDGTLWAWGANRSTGVLGNSSTAAVSSPVQIGAGTTWSTVVPAPSHTLAMKTDGTLWTWGGNTMGQLGDGTTTSQSSPIQLGAGTNWSKIAAGTNVSMAIKTDGTLWFWGQENNLFLQDYTIARRVGNSTNWSKIAAGATRSAAIRSDGTLWAWGTDSNGNMGLGTTGIVAYSPTQMGTDTTWTDIAVSDFNQSGEGTIALKSGTLWHWGNQWGSIISSPTQVGTDTNWSKIARGAGNFNFAIKTNGTLWSWGSAPNLPLPIWGDGTFDSYRTSTVQIGAATNWAEVKSGYLFTLALKTDGTLWAWGDNAYGQLGQNIDFSVPAQKTATTDWASVSVGSYSVLAIKNNGTLWTWGSGISLGLGSVKYIASPTQIGASTWSKVSSNDGGFCLAVRSDGTLWSWGSNSYGQLGTNSGAWTSSPVQVGALTTWQDVTSSYWHSGALRTDGTIWIWGNNQYGQLADGTTTHRSSPIQVGSGTNWAQITTGRGYDCGAFWAVKTDGTLWSWGNNQYGQLGDGTTVSKSSPIQIGSGTSWSSVYADTMAAALKTDGTLWVWGKGNSRYGAAISDVSSPVQIGTANWQSIWISNSTTHGIKTDGTLWAWGSGSEALGLGASYITAAATTPLQVGTDTNWKQVSSYGATFAVKTNGELWGWGASSAGKMLVDFNSPCQVGTDTNWASISAGAWHSMAIRSTGTLWAWGENGDGQLGDGTKTRRNSPVQIGAATDWIKATGGMYASFGLRGTGALYSWGSWKQTLGDGAASGRSSPVQVGTDTNWNDISATPYMWWGSYHCLATKNGGELWAWGNNSYYQLGILTASPVQIGAATTWSDVSVSYNGEFALATRTNGTLWAWGNNSSGQLGLNDTTFRSSPVQIGALTTWSKIATGYRASFSVKTDGSLWAWGDGTSGQTGLGSTGNFSSPVQVGVMKNWVKVVGGSYAASAKK